MKSSSNFHFLRLIANRFLKFLCGEENRHINRSTFWTMLSTVSTFVLLIITIEQLREVKETTSADFSHKVKDDLFTPGNVKLIALLDDSILIFKSDSENNAWFEVDTNLNKKLPLQLQHKDILRTYNLFEIDQLLQDFEDLAFYEKRGQIKFEYIYDQYAYYIEMIWRNREIQKYILWQRNQSNFSNTYVNFEYIYKKLKARTDSEK
jgi:hypothetical protein